MNKIMQANIPEAEIYETGKNNLKNPTIFVGFVGAGLVGTIAIDHMINELGMKEVGFLRSKHLPPSTEGWNLQYCNGNFRMGRKKRLK